MKFTDGDLHQLKTELNQGDKDIAIWAPCLQAFLHRLECAEKVIEYSGSPISKECYDAINAWRSSKQREKVSEHICKNCGEKNKQKDFCSMTCYLDFENKGGWKHGESKGER